MAKFTFKDILTKVSNVFKNDMYIIDYQFCLGGRESEDSNRSTFLCVLTPELMELVKEQFPENKNIFFSNVKKAKDDLSLYSDIKIKEDELKRITEKRNHIMKIISSIKSWNNFNFDETTVTNIFKNGDSIELFQDDEKIPSVTIGKTLFPLVTEKNANNMYYSVILPKENSDIYQLITSFDTEWFQIYNIIQYLNLSNE